MPTENKTLGNPWDKTKSESRAAWAAFKKYRDFGELRSLLKVWREHKHIPADQPVQVPGIWTDWSRRHKWNERCDAYDKHHDQIEEAVRDKRTAKNAARIADRQIDFEWKRQLGLEDQYERADAVLQRAEAAPITDEHANVDKTDIAKDGTKTITLAKIKKKGINYSGYARLIRQKFELASEAGLGPRHVAPTKIELGGNDGGAIQHDLKLEFSDPAVARAARDFARTVAVRRSGDGGHPKPGTLEDSATPGPTQ